VGYGLKDGMSGIDGPKVIEYLTGLRFEDLSFDVVEKAKLCILDSLGIALSGSLTPIGKIAREYAVDIGGRGECRLYVHGDRVSCIPAAYANGTMACCHNFTDTTLSCVVHCGPVVVPTAISVGEREGASGGELVASVVAGYELMTRVGNAVNSGKARMAHHQKGFHATATTGVFGAAVAAGKLLCLDVDRMVDAVGIAGSYASGLFESGTYPGTETWKTHTGIAAQNGVSSALLARFGLRGPPTILEGKQGFFAAFGDGDADPGKMGEELGKRLLIMDSAFKLHNCAHVWAVPLDCLKVIIAKHEIRAGDVSAITITIPTMYSYVMEQGREGKFPRNYAEAQNDLPYVAAAMVIHGGVSVETFERRVLEDPLMKEVAARVRVKIDPAMDEVFRGTDKAPATVTVLLRDGREFTETAGYPKGSPRNPAARAEIEEKFIRLASPVSGEDEARRIVDIVNDLEKLNNVIDLVDHLVARP
jgi:2-methylcitrate dehydratase PrpD